MGHIRRQHLRDSKVIVPPPDELQAADALLSGLLRQWVISSVENRCLADLRDALLPKLISGELRVGELDA